ncbi:MAG: ATP-binding protein [Chlorobi bacterium]|nr:ATP-binding protein [Chlorobiota bacterium]
MNKKLRIELKDFGQIKEGQVQIGDLTVLVGEQASGKTLFLELFKFIHDRHFIKKVFQEKGFTIDSIEDLFSLYFGCSKELIPVKEGSEIRLNGRAINLRNLKGRGSKNLREKESVFYIPAQRILTLADGWFKDFNAFSLETPFVVRHFSETMRIVTEQLIRAQRQEPILFPHPKRLISELKDKLQQTVFKGWKLMYKAEGFRKHLVLTDPSQQNVSLSFFSWSTGQREFVPLLLGLYWLSPSAKKSKRNFDYVVIEEPEMGLHPHAYLDVILILLTLLERGYKILISSHSPAILDVIWVLRNLFRLQDTTTQTKLFMQFFGLKKKHPWVYKLIKSLRNKDMKVFYFKTNNNYQTIIQDISELENFEEESIQNWGGLLSIADKASEVVSTISRKLK